jgi:gliding motility-associated-like protein
MSNSGKVPKTRGLRIFEPFDDMSDECFRSTLTSLPFLQELEGLEAEKERGRTMSPSIGKYFGHLLSILCIVTLLLGPSTLDAKNTYHESEAKQEADSDLLLPPVIFNPVINHVSCPGGSDASVDMNPTGGVLPYKRYDWSHIPGQNDTEDVSGLSAGTYIFRVRDDNNDWYDTTIVINEPAAMLFRATVTESSCPDTLNGAIDIDPIGGTPPYTFDWDSDGTGDFDDPEDLTSIPSGTYSLQIQDANLCVFDTLIEVSATNNLIFNAVITRPTCLDATSGQIDISPTGGAGPYTFDWDVDGTGDFDDTEDLTGLSVGTYHVAITDGTCTYDTAIVVSEAPNVSFNASVTPDSCHNAGSGSITLAPVGGTGTLLFDWNMDGTGDYDDTQDQTGLSAGTYTVSIMDDNLCVADTTIEIALFNPIMFNATIDTACFGQASGAISLAPAGGTAPYTFDWDTDGTGDFDDSQDIAGLAAGAYMLTIRDAALCTFDTLINVSEHAGITFDHVLTPVSCPGLTDGAIDLEPLGGELPYERIDWDHLGSSNNPEDVSGLDSGYYNVRIRDAQNCWIDTTFYVPSPDSIRFDPIVTQIGCAANSGAIDIQAYGGAGGYSYDWSTDGTGDFDDPEDLSSLTAGTYDLSIQDANLCQVDTSITLAPATAMVWTINSEDLSCSGANDGQADVSVSGGSAPYTYLWTGGSTNDTIFNLAAGKYYLTITDNSGCTALDSVTIAEPTALAWTIDSVNVSCFGGNDGQADVSVSGGTAPYTYLWTGGSTNDTIFDLTAGQYFLTITDDNGCIGQDSVTITEPIAPIWTIDSLNVSCFGGNNGRANVSVSGGAAPYTYLWTGGSTNDTIFDLTAGQYFLTITDDNGCIGQDSVTISEPTALSWTIDSVNVSCFGGNDGRADVSVSGGTAPYTYLWTGGSTNDTVFDLTAGQYFVTITDDNGCIGQDSVTIAEPTALAWSIDSVNVNCFGGNDGQADVSVSGGTAPYTYLWTGGSTNDTIFDLTAGQYFVTITDDNGCVGQDSVTIAEPTALAWTIDSVNVSCFGGNDGQADVSVSGGTAPYTYLWTGGSTNDTIFDLTAGQYFVTITDDNGCVGQDSVTIAEPTALAWTIDSVNVSCIGGNDGRADVSVSGGTAPYTYLWTGGSTNDTIFDLTAGQYFVTITDDNGCIGQDSVTIAEPTALAWTIDSVNVSCFGGNDGRADVSVSGGTAPYTYLWTGGSTNDTIFDLTAGQYFVTITDDNGCIGQDSVTIAEPTALAWSIDSVNVSCFGGNDGQADVSVSGGTAPYTYLWTGGSTNDTIFDLTAGQYFVTITDDNGCVGQDSVTIAEPSALAWTIDSVNVSCFGGNDGRADVSVSGGTAPYTYLWTGGSTNDTIFNLTAGQYFVTVTDDNGCVGLDSVTIAEPTALAWTIDSVNVSCFGGNDGRADVTVSGGTAPYTYLWTGGSTNDTIFDLTAGQYLVTITDDNGCIGQDSVTIAQPDTLVLSQLSTNVSCFGFGDGNIDMTITGGVSPYIIDWDNDGIGDADDTEDLAGLVPGLYAVSVTDANLCIAIDTVEITQPDTLVATATYVNISCTGYDDGSIDLTVVGGTLPYTFDWDNDGTGDADDLEDLAGLAPGDYTVIVTDANGCTAGLSVTILEPATLAISETHSDVSCNGAGDGSIDLTITGGSAPFDIDWDNDGTGDADDTEDLSGLVPGTYTVIVSDTSACTQTLSVLITQPAVLAVSEIHVDVLCNGASTGSIDLTITGGTVPYTIDWDNDGTGDADDSEDLTGLAAGTYTVMISDANGCSLAPLSIVIDEPTALVQSETHQDISCFGGNDGQIDLTVSGGVTPYTYDWDNDGTGDLDDTQDLVNLTSGTYTVAVTDFNGCPLPALAVNLTQPTGMSISEIHSNPTCNDGSNGSIDIAVIGGTFPYTYDWSTDGVGDYDDAQDISGLSSGTYDLSVRDDQGCFATESVTLTFNTLIVLDEVISDVSCNGDSDGSIGIAISGNGATPLSFDWDMDGVGDNDDAKNQSALSAGTHTIIVTDNNGCTETESYTVSEPPLMEITLSKTNTTCTSLSDGTASVAITGGTSPYNISWSTGANTNTISGLAAGWYIASVTDAQSCMVVDSIEIPMIPLLSANSSIVSDYNGRPLSCTGSTDGVATASPTGGSPSYTYSWSNGQSGPTLNNVGDGTYTVTITDGRSCTAQSSVTFTDPAPFTITVVNDTLYNGQDITCNGASDGALEVLSSGAVGSIDYTWVSGQTTPSISGLGAGTYEVEAEDENACTATGSLTITDPSPLTISLSTSDYGGFEVSCSGGNDGSITATVNGGTTNYSYLWNNGTTSATNSSVDAGYHEVVVTDANGCVISDDVILDQPSNINVTTATSAPSDCGVNDGIIQVNATGGISPYEYRLGAAGVWQSSQFFSGLATGTYQVYVRSTTGSCEVGPVTSVVPAAEVPDIDNITIINPTTGSSNDGGLLIQASGNGQALQYRIDGLTPWQSSNLFNGLDEGTITVQVRYLSQNCIAEEVITLVAGAGVVGTPSNTQICSQELNGTAFLETYYIPLAEDDIETSFQSIFPATCPRAIPSGGATPVPASPIISYNSIGVVEQGSVLFYDHWEDGYEANIEFPIQPTTEIWGDNDPSNGIAPGYATDIFNAADIIVLQSTVDVSSLGDIDFDGGDRFASRGDLSYSRMIWAQNSGTFFAGSAEVYATERWGTAFQVPVGENVTTDNLFEYTGANIVAGDNGATVTINNGTTTTMTLTQGENILIDGGLNAGATITSDNPIHVILITGDVCENYESRFFTLTPTDIWSDNYYNPVSTEFEFQTYVFLYNPNAGDITVQYEGSGGFSGSQTVPGGQARNVTLPDGIGSRFYTTDESRFYAIATVDSRDGSTATGRATDWGYALLPYTQLSSQITLVGFAPGENPLAPAGINASPIWITADHPDGSPFSGSNIQLNIDLDGDDIADLTPTIPELGQYQVFDTSDGDQTGTRIWVADGSDAFIAGAYGQEPSIGSGTASALDLGTGLFNKIPFSAGKCVDLYTDYTGNGLYDECDEVIYTLIIRNTGSLPLAGSSVRIIDTLDAALTYLPNSTTTFSASGINTVPDDGTGVTVFPLDEDGYLFSDIVTPGDSVLVRFAATINDASSANFISNIAHIQNINTSLSPEVSFPAQNPAEVSLPGIPSDTTVNCDVSLLEPPYRDTCLSKLFIDQKNWNVQGFSTETVGNEASLAIDGNADSYWLSNGLGSLPQFIDIDLGIQENGILGFTYLPRQDDVSARIEDYQVYVSDDAIAWGAPVATGTWADDDLRKDVELNSLDARYIRLVALSATDGGNVVSAAEITVQVCDQNVTYNESTTQTSNGTCTDIAYVITRDWEVENYCGNVATQTQNITVQDTVAPSLFGVPADVTVFPSAVPVPATPTATDNCDSSPVVAYNVDTTMVGCMTYITRTWTATDVCGNSSAESQVIEVMTCPEDCNNGIDDDGDGLIDCDDPDCINGLALTLNNDTTVCINEPVTLNAEATGGYGPYTYVWDQGLGAGAQHTVNVASNTSYSVTATDVNGCEVSGSVDVSVDNTTLSIWRFKDLTGAGVPITDGATYQLSSLPASFNIQINSTANVGSIEFTVSGDLNDTYVDNSQQYRYPGDFTPFTAGIGTYTFCADLYALDGAQGGLCQTSCITFTLIDQEICYDGIDNDGDGLIDCEDGDCNGNTDCPDNDQDGITDDIDIDDDNDGILDVTENACGSPCDTDGDGVPDYFDLDSDNDGIYDVVESGGPDANEDGIIGNGTFVDTDNDGWSDIADSDNGGGPMPDIDSDGDGIQDRLELDSDNDGCSDVIEAGYSDDDMDGILGNSPVAVDFDGLVTSSPDGYTIPTDREVNGVYDFQEDHTISITCPTDITSGVSTGTCGANITVPLPTVEDACGGYSLVNDFNGGDDASGVYPVGVTVVEFIATDSTGTSVACTMNVTVQDNESPVADLATLPAVNGQCSVSVTAPSATDNCDGAITATTFDPTSYSSQGSYTITWTYTDAAGNTTVQTQSVEVDDITTPVPDVVNLPTINEECSASLSAPTATDNCVGAITATTTDATSYSSEGTYTVTWLYEDGNGNSRTQTQTVIIDDVTDPVPAVATLPDVVAECSTTLTAPTSMDNCSGLITATTSAPTSYSAQGTYTLNWIHDDGNGNVVIQPQTVIIDDTTAPSPDVASLPDAVAECDTTITAPTATDNCEGAITATTTDPTTYSSQGTYVITWTYDDGNGNSSTQTQNVIIDDTTSPVPDVASLPAITEECAVTLVAPTATDNCEGAITATTTDPTYYSSQGSYTVTWNYDDGNGNTSQQTQSVTIADITAPIAVCQDTTIDLGGGTVVLDPAVVDGGSSDNCPGMSLSVSPNTFSAVGIYTVTLTATDVAGNTDECTAQVTVEDTSPPLCVARDTTLYLDASGMVSINSIDLDGGSTDNGVIVNYLASDTMFTCSDVNVPTAPISVTLTLTDDGGNTSNCISQVTVLDTIAPQVFCQDVTLELDSNGVAILNPDTLDFGSFDACDITFTADITDFDCSMTGDNTVILIATDPSGNSSTCTSTVTVEDNILPVMTCTPAIEVDNDPGVCGAIVNYTIPAVTDNCSASITAQPGSGHNPGDFFPVGTTWVGYYATNPSNGATVTCWFPITVNDTEGPMLTCPANDTVPANADCEFILADYTSQVVATDNCDDAADLTITQDPAPGTTLAGSTLITFTVTDDEGNSTQCDMTVVVQDETDPQIDPLSCPGDETVYLDVACEYEIGDYTGSLTVTDNCTPSASLSIVQDPPAGSIMTGDGSTEVITLTVADANGNESFCIFTLTALDTIAPVIDPLSCPGDQTVSLNDTCFYILPDYRTGLSITDNCEAPVDLIMTQSPAPGTALSGDGTMQAVVLTVDDGNGNTSTCEFTVTVEDDTQPVFVTCAENDTVSANNACEFIIGDYTGEVIVTDNCGNASTITLTQNPAPGSTVSGTTTVIITAEDQNGVTNTCSFVVVVEDTTDPQIDMLSCPGDQDVFLDNGCEYVIGDYTGVLNVSDNCTPSGSINIVQVPASGTVMSGHGDTETITLTATDANGNESICSFVLTALDTITPVISCPADITQNVDAGMPTAVITYVEPAGTDNCSGAVTTQIDGTGLSTGSAFPVGTSTLTYQVVDAAGLSATCSFDITVVDNSGPEVICPDTVDVDAPLGHCDTDGAISINVPVATDNDGVASLINDFNGTADASGIYPVGITVVTWTATDNSGNTATCEQIVVVNDVEAPSNLVCPNDTTISATAGECGIDAVLVVLTEPTATDPCNDLFISNDAPAYYNVGETTVTWTIADSTGNAVYCTQLVTITDDELPTQDPASCPADQTVTVDDGECGTASTNVSLVGPTATDPCGIFDVYNNAPDTFEVGTTVVTWYIEDNNGNIDSTCTQQITVIDDEDPIIVDCPAPVDVNATIGECGIDSSLVDIGTLTATDPCGIDTIYNDAPVYYPVGTTIVTWTIIDSNGNPSICTQNVVVNDIEVPSNLVCPNDTTISATVGECGINAALVVLTEPTATDPCNDLFITNDAPAYYNVGETTVTWTIADSTGNAVYCTQLVTVTDDELPTQDPASCPEDQTVTVDDGECGTASANVTLVGPTATDPCGIFDVYNNAPDTFEVGTTVVTWYIEDNNGNIDSTCTQQITVIDDEDPIIVDCPAPVDIDATIGECGIDSSLVDIGTLTASDPCGVATVSNDAPDYYPVGQTVVTWTVTDSNGNESTCEQTVTVHDIEAPSDLVCPADTSIAATLDECGINSALVQLTMPTAYDPCNELVITNDAPAYYPVDTTIVTWTIADTSGNAVYCTQTVIILDTQTPVTTLCPTDTIIENDADQCSAVYTYPEPEATDNCGVSEIIRTQGLASGEEFPVGDNYVEYEITDVNGNVTVCGFTVTVLDTQVPEFNDPIVIDYEQIEGECESIVTFNIPVGEDNCPGVITAQIDDTGLTSGDIFPVGQTTLTYLATDASGNTTSIDVLIDVLDTEDPVVLSCPEDMVLSADSGLCTTETFLLPPAAMDNCGTVTMVHDAPAQFSVGVTTVTWTVSDLAGNTQLCYLDVVVIDDQAPVIECPEDVIVTAPWGACEVTVEVDSMLATDNCGIASIQNDRTATESASDVYPLGQTVVSWIVTDVNGNTTTCQTTVTVNTSGAPMIDCEEEVSVTNEEGVCSAMVTVPQPEFEYDCAIVSVVNDYTDSDDASGIYPVGETLVTWTVTDISGNSSQCVTVVTVVDTEVPTIECQEDISVVNDPGICGAFVNYELPTIWDNCAIEELVLIEGVEPGGLFNDGTTVVQYMVTDIHGNSATCSFEVTVSDEEAPMIFCPADIVQIDSIVNYPYPDLSDNCYAELILIDGPESGEEFDHGYTEVVYAAVDLNGNMDTCGFQVLVNTPPVAENDTLVLFESDDNIIIDILENDYDLDGDSIWVSGILFGSDKGYSDGRQVFYDIPDNECGIDSLAYILQDEFGATDTAIVYVEVSCYPSIFVPEGFSPNGDGVNDNLRILGLHEYPNNTLKIFNRYGHKVLDRNGYENDWDGRSEASLTIGDTYLPRGTYYYILDIGSANIKPLKGFIYINPR